MAPTPSRRKGPRGDRSVAKECDQVLGLGAFLTFGSDRRGWFAARGSAADVGAPLSARTLRAFLWGRQCARCPARLDRSTRRCRASRRAPRCGSPARTRHSVANRPRSLHNVETDATRLLHHAQEESLPRGIGGAACSFARRLQATSARTKHLFRPVKGSSTSGSSHGRLLGGGGRPKPAAFCFTRSSSTQ